MNAPHDLLEARARELAIADGIDADPEAWPPPRRNWKSLAFTSQRRLRTSPVLTQYANIASSRESARQIEGLDLPRTTEGHNAMLSMPGALVTLLAAIN